MQLSFHSHLRERRMRIGIQGWGSEGDLRPLVAFALRLRREGHEPRLVLSPVDEMDHGPLLRQAGIPFQLVPEQMPVTLRSICEASRSRDPSKVSRALMDFAYFPYQEAMYAAALDLCAASDAVVGLFSSSYVKAACLKTGTPFVAAHYYPGMVPSAVVPPLGIPAWRWLNPLSWALLGKVIDLAFLKPNAAFFASKGLPRPRRSMPDVLASDRLNLMACSPTLYPRPADWPERYCLCGDFHVPDDAQAWEPPDDLRAFLDGGAPPVLVSFGTLELLAPERSRDLAVAAVRRAGVRAVIQSKAGAATGEGRDGDVYFLRWAPHGRLLPRCAAMVLHGGAGTTHAALRGGVPAVPVPFIFEQGLWGGLLHRAGSATRPLPFWKATPDTLAARIREAVSSQALRARARVLASAVAAEDGTGVAVRRLEAVCGERGARGPATSSAS